MSRFDAHGLSVPCSVGLSSYTPSFVERVHLRGVSWSYTYAFMYSVSSYRFLLLSLLFFLLSSSLSLFLSSSSLFTLHSSSLIHTHTLSLCLSFSSNTRCRNPLTPPLSRPHINDKPHPHRLPNYRTTNPPSTSPSLTPISSRSTFCTLACEGPWPSLFTNSCARFRFLFACVERGDSWGVIQ